MVPYWQSGRGPAIDPEGNIYFETGNGDWDGASNFGESLLKLRVTQQGLEVTDWFTPSDYSDLNARDAEFGSSGPMLNPCTRIVVCGDKHGVLRLLNIDDPGKSKVNSKQLIQSLAVNGGRVLSGPAYWNGPSGPLVYIWGEADFLKAFHFNGSSLDKRVYARGKATSHGSPERL